MRYRELLEYAQLQYKFALAVSTNIQFHKFPDLVYHDAFAYGPHVFEKEELMLSKEQEQLAAILLVHSATYLCAVQADTVLQATIPDRFKHSDPNIRSASWIARLIRNAFAHNPFAPVWKTYSECENQTYAVENVISLKTSGLDGKPVQRLDYGGPLALLRLLDFVKQVATKAETTP